MPQVTKKHPLPILALTLVSASSCPAAHLCRSAQKLFPLQLVRCPNPPAAGDSQGYGVTTSASRRRHGIRVKHSVSSHPCRTGSKRSPLALPAGVWHQPTLRPAPGDERPTTKVRVGEAGEKLSFSAEGCGGRGRKQAMLPGLIQVILCVEQVKRTIRELLN